jgi:hypothetical protein
VLHATRKWQGKLTRRVWTRLLRRFACCAVSRVATFHALRSYIYSSAVRLMCPGPPADLPSAYPYLAFTRKTTNLPLCGRTHRLLIVHLGSVNLVTDPS